MVKLNFRPDGTIDQLQKLVNSSLLLNLGTATTSLIIIFSTTIIRLAISELYVPDVGFQQHIVQKR